MWKIIIIVCTLGNPCVMMEEEPMRLYKTKSECLANASVKFKGITETFQQNGYQIENGHFDCEQDKFST